MHKHTGIEGSFSSPSDLCNPAQQSPHSVVDRQHNGDSLHQSQRRHPFSGPIEHSNQNVGVVFGKKPVNSCRTHPRKGECQGGQESRRSLDPSDWFLNRTIFKSLEAKWGPFDVDLFVAHHNKQLKRYFSFRPDPQAEGIDALAHLWSNLRPYVFQPFILLGRILHKIEQEGVKEVVLIAPIWANQPRFPRLLESLVDLPITLPGTPTLLRNPLGEPHPLVIQGCLRLAAWKVSGAKSKIEVFQRKLSRSSVLHGDMAPRNPIICLVKVGLLVQ